MLGGVRSKKKVNRKKKRVSKKMSNINVPYENSKYNKKTKKLKICVGNDKFVDHKNVYKYLLKDVKFFIRQDSRDMKLDSNYDLTLSEINKWEKWAKAKAMKYIKKYAGKVKNGKKWEVGMGPGQIVRELFEDWESSLKK